MKKILYSDDLEIQRELERMLLIDKRRYSSLVKALKTLGNFNSNIEVNYDEQKDVNYVVDNNDNYYFFGNYFDYPSKYNYRDKYLLAKKHTDNKYCVYDFFSDCVQVKEIYVVDDNMISFSRHNHIKDGYNFVYKNGNFICNIFLWSKDEKTLEVDDFIIGLLDEKPTTLMQVVEKFNQSYHINGFNKVNFNVKKDDVVISYLDFKDGEIEKLNIVEEAGDEEIHIFLNDGNIQYKSIRKVPILVYEANEKIKNTYTKVYQLLKK